MQWVQGSRQEFKKTANRKTMAGDWIKVNGRFSRLTRVEVRALEEVSWISCAFIKPPLFLMWS